MYIISYPKLLSTLTLDGCSLQSFSSSESCYCFFKCFNKPQIVVRYVHVKKVHKILATDLYESRVSLQSMYLYVETAFKYCNINVGQSVL